MKFILVLGMPRSGTSLVCEILEKMGLDFALSSNNTLDSIYKNTTHLSFYQNKEVHLHLMSKGVTNFLSQPHVELNHDIFKAQVIKEPYLVGVLDNIRHLIDKIILVVRNPIDVIASSNKFYKQHGSSDVLSEKTWNTYYTTFIHSVGDLPFFVVNYDQMMSESTKTIDSLFSFLSIPKKEINVTLYTDHGSKTIFLEKESMILYKGLSNHVDTNKIKNMLLHSKCDICFCGSGKKFRKCCRQFHIWE